MPFVQTLMQFSQQQDELVILSGGDREKLTLHAHDEALIKKIAAVNPKTIVAVMGGSAVIMEGWREQVPTILMLWYPGMEGGHALADVLLGQVNPSGKLPFAIPKRADDLPFFDMNATEIEYDLWHGYRKLERDGQTPAFPFGFGLSYTNYEYANLTLEKDQLIPSEILKVSLDVSNTGTQAGDEIVQLYISAIGSAVERAPKELKSFRRITLQPGETKPVHFNIPLFQFAYYDEALADFLVEPIEYEIFVGAHSLDHQALRARLTVHSDN
jgi:beta-glucosidase